MSSRRASRPVMGRTNHADHQRRESENLAPNPAPPSRGGRVKPLDLRPLKVRAGEGGANDVQSLSFRHYPDSRNGSSSSRASTAGGRPGWLTDRRVSDRARMEDVDSTVEEVRRLFKQKQSTAKTSVQARTLNLCLTSAIAVGLTSAVCHVPHVT
eukprot:90040-Rhodomonas_salina.1